MLVQCHWTCGSETNMEIVNPVDIKVEVNDDFDDGDNNNTQLISTEQPLALVKKKNIEVDNITERFPYIDEVLRNFRIKYACISKSKEQRLYFCPAPGPDMA